jgi:hypothetical protein
LDAPKLGSTLFDANILDLQCFFFKIIMMSNVQWAIGQPTDLNLVSRLWKKFFWQTFPWVVPLGTTCQNCKKVGPNFKNKISSIYTLVYLIGLGGLCVPHLCTHLWKIMNTQKPIICINILILEPSLTHSEFFSFKCPYTYTLDIFSCLFSTCTREWSKLIIKTTKGENSYHLCS